MSYISKQRMRGKRGEIPIRNDTNPRKYPKPYSSPVLTQSKPYSSPVLNRSKPYSNPVQRQFKADCRRETFPKEKASPHIKKDVLLPRLTKAQGQQGTLTLTDTGINIHRYELQPIQIQTSIHTDTNFNLYRYKLQPIQIQS